MASRRALAGQAAVVTVVLFVTGWSAVQAISEGRPDKRGLFVQPGATGNCTKASPCGSIATAVRSAGSGSTITLAAGDYPAETLPAINGDEQWRDQVVIAPANGARAHVGELSVNTSHVTLRGIDSAGVAVNRDAERVHLEQLRLDPGWVVLYGPEARLVGSRVRPAPDTDAVVIGVDANKTVVDGNVIGPGIHTPGNRVHVDCIQVLGGPGLRLTRNVMFRCQAQTLWMSAVNAPLTDVLITRNLMQDCLRRSESCDGYFAVYLDGSQSRHPMSGVRFLDNTVDGSMIVKGFPVGTQLQGNILKSVSGCSSSFRNNLVGSSTCAADLGAGNAWGSPVFVAPSSPVPDLHLAPGSPGIDSGLGVAAARDLDGDVVCGRADVGGDEYCVPVAASPPPVPVVTPPTRQVTSVPRPSISVQPRISATTLAVASSAPPSSPPPPTLTAPEAPTNKRTSWRLPLAAGVLLGLLILGVGFRRRQ